MTELWFGTNFKKIVYKNDVMNITQLCARLVGTYPGVIMVRGVDDRPVRLDT